MTPVCECHGEPKSWRNDPGRPEGGRWLCSVKRRESARRAAARRLPNRFTTAPLHALLDRLDPEHDNEEIAAEMEASGFWKNQEIAARVLRRIRNQAWVELRTLDHLLIALGREHLWHTTPEWSVA